MTEQVNRTNEQEQDLKQILGFIELLGPKEHNSLFPWCHSHHLQTLNVSRYSSKTAALIRILRLIL